MRHRTVQLRSIIVIGAMLCGLCVDCGFLHALPIPPALELKKVISFPLSGDSLPATQDGLAAAITTGLKNRVVLPAGARIVSTEGSNYPSLDQLTVDFTNAGISSDRTLPKLKPRGVIEPAVRTRDFHFFAAPMKVDGADIHLDIHAHDVDLGLQRDLSTRPILVLTAAKDGRVQCDTTMADLSKIFRASANARGHSYGLSVSRADLRLKSENAHQLQADLKLTSWLLFVPIALHFTARVDVNDAGDAHMSNLTCDGNDIAGWLISGFIRPSLAKYNGKTIPLIAFPTDEVKLHDLRVRIEGDDVHVNAAFGS